MVLKIFPKFEMWWHLISSNAKSLARNNLKCNHKMIFEPKMEVGRATSSGPADLVSKSPNQRY